MINILGRRFYVSSLGLSVETNKDTLLYFWPWTRPNVAPFKMAKFYSKALDQNFLSKSTYTPLINYYLGRVDIYGPKIVGFTSAEVIQALVNYKYSIGWFVTLHDINPMKKSSDFWRALPEEKAKILLKDVVILRCKDIAEVQDICRSIDNGFATVLGWRDGNLIDWNGE